VFSTVYNIITESFSNDYGTNRWISTNNKCNLYWSFPHFEHQILDRYPDVSNKVLVEKITKAVKMLNSKRLFRQSYRGIKIFSLV
jgi:hypothetical protein